jgi:predicted kinase
MKKSPKLLILVGPPGAGKSTFAKYLLRTEENWFRVCRDDLRLMQFTQENLTEENEAKLTRLVDASVDTTLRLQTNVVLDATNTRKSYLMSYIEKFSHLADIEFKVFNVSKEELVQRCSDRHEATGKYIPKAVLESQITSMERLMATFDFSPRKKTKIVPIYKDQDASIPTAIVCDLDGTLAIIHHRNPYDASTCEQDGLNTPVADVVKSFAAQGDKIIFVSGRENKYRPQTERWLAAHNIQYHDLIMRASGDHRKDSIIKREIYDTQLDGKYNIRFVLDDRNQVVDMWRKDLGLTCLQVEYGDF